MRSVSRICLLTSHVRLVNAARKVEPALPAGNTSYKVEDAVYQFRYDASKSTHILGLKYRTIDESAADTVKQFKEKGWIQ